MSDPAEHASAAPPGARPLRELAWFFLKLGTIAFGGPAAHIAMMEAEVVRERRWVTREQFLDLLGAVNLIPGPNSTEMAIHLGLVRAGWRGLIVAGVPRALLATFGIFFPSFVFVAASNPIIPRLRRSRWTAGFLDGVNVASLGLMAAVTWHLGRAALVDAVTVGIAVVAAVLVFRLRPNSAWLVLGGALIGIVTHLLR